VPPPSACRHLSAIEQRARLQGQVAPQGPHGAGSQRLESQEIDALDVKRVAFLHRDRQGDAVLLIVQLHVEGRDLRVRISPVPVVRLDPFRSASKTGRFEVALAPPRQASCWTVWPAPISGASAPRVSAPLIVSDEILMRFSTGLATLLDRVAAAGAFRLGPAQDPSRPRPAAAARRNTARAREGSDASRTKPRFGRRLFQGWATASSERTSATPVVCRATATARSASAGVLTRPDSVTTPFAS
jgi:hypothetical protein